MIFKQTSIFFITSETESKFPLAAVIGGSCVGLFLLPLAICLCKKVKERSFCEDMPRDDLYPGDSEYELEDRREGTCYNGEEALLHTEARSVGLGHTNEAACYEEL